MFLLTAVILMICGILLLWKTSKLSARKELRVVLRLCAILMILFGIASACLLLSGNIVLPLH